MDPTLRQNLRDLLHHAFEHAAPTPALIVTDARSPLARLLSGAYREVLPHAALLDIDAAGPDAVRAAAAALPPGSLVVLVQSTRFEMGAHRFRMELFRLGLQVIEHPHVDRIRDTEIAVYVDALAYDPGHLRGLGRALQDRIGAAQAIEVCSPRGVLRYRGPFEDARLNVGDYTGMPHVGGQFPIGEVFTEPVDLEAVSGEVAIAAFGAEDFSVTFPDQPFGLQVAQGRVVAAPDAPASFHAILAAITAEEGQVWLRELGFGLNRAMTLARRVSDVSTYERMCGVHLSLGAKHAVYPKPGFNKRHTRFHVDVFCATERVDIDGAQVYADGRYTITRSA